MKKFIVPLAMALSLAAVAPAFAQDTGTGDDKAPKADEEKGSTGPTAPETSPDDEAK